MAVAMSLTILHEDARLIAVAKPAGQLVIPGRGDALGHVPDLAAEVSAHLGGKAYVIHRLDREASGLVLCAKDPQTHRELSLRFEHREVKKTYRVLAQGQVRKEGYVDQPIREFGSGRMGLSGDGKPSMTRYRVLERFHEATLLEVKPETGRRHQIRVHLYSIGHPVMGDWLYGKEKPVGGARRLMLHAYRLEFESAGAALNLRAEPPADFQIMVAACKARDKKIISGDAT